MTDSVLRKRSESLKKKWPDYAPILAFYVATREAQLASKPEIPPTGGNAFAHNPDNAARFEIDTIAARSLFAELCDIGRLANLHFATQVDGIEACLERGLLDLDPLLGSPERTAVEMSAEASGASANVLHFLIKNAVRPSLELFRDSVLQDIDMADWKQMRCPVCGGKPTLNMFAGDPSQRLSVCDDCNCEWPIERLPCPVCGKNEKDARAYFHNDGQEAFRVDTCDTCQHYIKTIDFTLIDRTDPVLEDLATLHLDVIARDKGYERAVPNDWSD